MRWRTVGGAADQAPEDKPTLSAVLDHYDAHYHPSRRSQMIRCLLHDDRTPSLSVDLNKGVWNCHSCGNGGDSYALIMKKEGIDFGGAREFATSLGLAAGSTGGSDGGVSGSRYGGRRSVSPRSGDRQGSGGYVPAWRRS